MALASVTEAIIHIMRAHDQYDRDGQQPVLKNRVKLLGGQKYGAHCKQQYRLEVSVVLDVAVIKGIAPDNIGDEYHAPFKINIVDDVNPKNR